jgi:hypothetical protein
MTALMLDGVLSIAPPDSTSKLESPLAEPAAAAPLT